MTQKHTPVPWTYQRLQPYMKGCSIGTGNLAIPTASMLIATAWNTTRGLSGPQDAETEANARFIVRACNAHEELLAGLQALMRTPYILDILDYLEAHDPMALEKMRAALTKASPQARGPG